MSEALSLRLRRGDIKVRKVSDYNKGEKLNECSAIGQNKKNQQASSQQ